MKIHSGPSTTSDLNLSYSVRLLRSKCVPFSEDNNNIYVWVILTETVNLASPTMTIVCLPSIIRGSFTSCVHCIPSSVRLSYRRLLPMDGEPVLLLVSIGCLAGQGMNLHITATYYFSPPCSQSKAIPVNSTNKYVSSSSREILDGMQHDSLLNCESRAGPQNSTRMYISGFCPLVIFVTPITIHSDSCGI